MLKLKILNSLYLPTYLPTPMGLAITGGVTSICVVWHFFLKINSAWANGFLVFFLLKGDVMEQCSNNLPPGYSRIPSWNMPKQIERDAWAILSGFDTYHASSDAILFSSSLPVLPHEKLKLKDKGYAGQSVNDSLSSLDKLNEDMEGIELLEDVETHAIGSFLPDDEDELLAGIMDYTDLSNSRLPSSLEDLEDYDIFGSSGGMELESDLQGSLSIGISKLNLSDGIVGNGIPNYRLPNGVGTVAGEHPFGEHPSRTLFVRNINSNVEDVELRTLFEDIPSDKDVNQGTLVAFNLDPSVSNEELRHIFGAYGEIKEIRETPHKKHHKFIEFYDVRAAEAALKSLNRSDVAGKRIKLEPSRPGGARRNLMLQLNQELEQDDYSQGFHHPVGSPATNSPPGNWAQFSSPIEHSPLQSISKSPVFRNLSPKTSTHIPGSGLVSVLHPQASNSVTAAPIGEDQERGSLMKHMYTNANSSNGAAFWLSHSLPESKFSQCNGSMPSFTPSKSNASVMETLSGPQFLWGSLNRYSEQTTSSAWPTLPMGQPYSSNGNGQGFPYSSRHVTFLGSSQHHCHPHVGSAPSRVPLEGHLGFLPESLETSVRGPVSFGGMGLGHNDGNVMMNMGGRASMNTGFTIARNMAENGTSDYRMMSLQRPSPAFLGNGPYPGTTAPRMEGLIENGWSRRVEHNGNQVDSKKQFQLELARIISGEDTRTTLMIKNIPNKYTSKMLLAAIDENHRGTYDFLYLPIDFKNKCNVGYAFINMLSPSHIIPFYEVFNGKKWEKFNSEKVASLAYARIQGKAALVTHFQNSSLMYEDKRCRPLILFPSGGHYAGDQIIQEHLLSNSSNIQFHQADLSNMGDSFKTSIKDGSKEEPEKS